MLDALLVARNPDASRRRLPAGDYAVEAAGRVVAAVERTTLEDLAGSLLSGRLTYALAELGALPRAAVVVEDRYSRLFELAHVSGTAVAEATAGLEETFAPGRPVPAPAPSARSVRTWARSQGIEVSDRGRVPADLLRAYAEAGEATP